MCVDDKEFHSGTQPVIRGAPMPWQGIRRHDNKERKVLRGFHWISRVQGFGRIPVQEARRKASILSVSCRSMTNFVKMLLGAVFKRNSGRLWRRALATTSSEGGMPGRMVRNQEPNEFQTS